MRKNMLIRIFVSVSSQYWNDCKVNISTNSGFNFKNRSKVDLSIFHNNFDWNR